MNRKIALVSAVLFTAAVATTTAQAGTDVHISIGFGNVITRPLPPRVVVVERPPVPRGYWKTVKVREWVPGRWIVERDRRGRPVRYFEPGYYTYRDERVWVDSDRGDRRGDWNRGYRR